MSPLLQLDIIESMNIKSELDEGTEEEKYEEVEVEELEGDEDYSDHDHEEEGGIFIKELILTYVSFFCW